MTGWLGKSIAWMLMEHGVLTRDELHGLIDCPIGNLRGAVDKLRASSYVQIFDSSHGEPGVNRKVYSLTPAGMARVAELYAEDITGLRQPGDPLLQQPQRSYA